MPFFVYLRNPFGGEYQPQKWSEKLTLDGKPISTVAEHEITQDEFNNLGLHMLRRKYPPPEQKEE